MKIFVDDLVRHEIVQFNAALIFIDILFLQGDHFGIAC